jgi:CheY-like chemotaxis protein
MSSFEQFRQDLRDALTHLHDPDYCPSPLVYSVMDCNPEHGAGHVQFEITEVIKELEPSTGAPLASRSRRDFDLLCNRFVLRLTQEETAERLNLSVRSVRRAQRTATHTLARLLWEHGLAREEAIQDTGEGKDIRSQEEMAQTAQSRGWRSQVKQDLASLQESTPAAVADVDEAIRYAVELESVLLSKQGIRLKTERVEPDLVAAIHPAVLRQVLVMAIGLLVRHPLSGDIAIQALSEGEDIRITLAALTSEDNEPDGNLISEIMSSQGGSVHVETTENLATVSIKVPSAGKVAVLIVDDNLDIVHFYRRCTVGTRYHILHAAQGQRTVEAIQVLAPDIIVLDIILPDADGWELLEELHRHPRTRPIPVVVCSIVREKDLASAFGAALYLPKPVQRREFIQALDRVLAQASEGAPKSQANNAAAC